MAREPKLSNSLTLAALEPLSLPATNYGPLSLQFSRPRHTESLAGTPFRPWLACERYRAAGMKPCKSHVRLIRSSDTRGFSLFRSSTISIERADSGALGLWRTGWVADGCGTRRGKGSSLAQCQYARKEEPLANPPQSAQNQALTYCLHLERF